MLFLHSRSLFLYCFHFNFCLELMLNLITGDLNLVNINVWFLWFNKNSSIKKLNIDIKCQKEIIFFKNCLSSNVSFNWISFPFFFLDLLGIVLSLLQHTMTGNSERDCRPQNLDLWKWAFTFNVRQDYLKNWRRESLRVCWL